MTQGVAINLDRLLGRITALGQVGGLPNGGCARIALTDADKAGRDLVVQWMIQLGLEISIDGIGNVFGLLTGTEAGPPLMIGSHIDTVGTGGWYDGNLGVLAGLEVVEALRDAGVENKRPIAVAFFTNEEGVRYSPDMMGSLVYAGGLALDEALDTVGIDGTRLGDELQRIGYAGNAEIGAHRPFAYLELHIEQGPVLEREGITIGAVTGVQGISWTEYTFKGVSNHAGTTPMPLRHDAGYCAMALAGFVRELATRMGGTQVGTVGRITLEPNLINVVPRKAVMTVDVRNTDEALLAEAEVEVADFAAELAEREGVTVESRSLVRLSPVDFDLALVNQIEQAASARGFSVKRMPSGAGHDAQMVARLAPTAMIFIPSVDGISHNIREHSHPADIEAGANILMEMALKLACD